MARIGVPHSDSFIRFETAELQQSITARFEKMAALYPRRLAVRTRTRELTYDELRQTADEIAYAVLNERGEKPEAVGMFVQDACLAIASVLGVLKSGKFYVPLSRSAPRARLAPIIESCGIQILITDHQHDELVGEIASSACRVLGLDAIAPDRSTSFLAPVVPPDGTAAVFFTSGSTGRPKGVIQAHHNILNRAMLATNCFGITADDRLALLAAPTYSASLWTVFGALLNGAAVYPFNILDEGIGELPRWLSRERITIYHSVPSIFRQWITNTSRDDDFSKLRVLCLGGETVTNHDVDLYKKLPSNCIFVNTLASNETGLIRQYCIDKTTEITDRIVPVGYEFDEKEVLILNEDGQKLGPDEVGEIAVRSAFLSPGYWGQPDLTATRFAPDPEMPGKRIYRTGDLGRLLPDGCLLYSGRNDFRAKIRGARVESEEIEAILHSHPSISEAAVAIREQESGGQTLIAFVVLKPQAVLTATSLRRFLAAQIPNNMLPSAFVFLHALPRTTNGKVDRQALPALTREVDGEFVAPRDALEMTLTNIWENVLRVQPISVRDNFFDLGGDSLTALQLIASVENTFDKVFLPGALFLSPTVEQMATMLRDEAAVESWSSLVKFQSGSEQKAVFCFLHSGGFENEFITFAMLAPRIGREYSFYGVIARGTDGVSLPHRSVEEMAAAYIAEIKAIQPTGPYFLLGECLSGHVAFETARQLQQGGDRVGLLALLDGRVRSHWYYKFIGPTLGAHIRDCIVSLKNTSIGRYLEQAIPFHVEKLENLSGIGRIRYVFSRLGKAALPVTRQTDNFEVTPTRRERIANRNYVLADKSRHHRRAYKAYRLAIRRYQNQPYSGQITIIANEQWYKSDPTLGWVATEGVEIYKMPGNHHNYLGENLRMIAELLKACLKRGEEDTKSTESRSSSYA